MHNQTIKSFKITERAVELFEDKDGTDCAVVLPKWMLDQIFEKCFNVKIVPSDATEKVMAG